MGFGNICAVSANVNLFQISGNSYTATTLDSTALTNEDFFNMPARSLFVEYDEKNNEVWLNIPAQLVYRDSSTNQFTFTGLYYSNSAVFENDYLISIPTCPYSTMAMAVSWWKAVRNWISNMLLNWAA